MDFKSLFKKQKQWLRGVILEEMCTSDVSRVKLLIMHHSRPAADFRTRVGIYLTFRNKFLMLSVMLPLTFTFGAGLCYPSDLFVRGVNAAKAGELERAATLFSKVIKKDPSSYAAHVNRGSVLLRSGYVLRGILDWHKARDLAPMFAYAVYTGDLITHSSGKGPWLEYALSTELDPDHVASVMMMGVAYMDFGRGEMALELFKKSGDLTRNPLLKNNWEYWANSLELFH